MLYCAFVKWLFSFTYAEVRPHLTAEYTQHTFFFFFILCLRVCVLDKNWTRSKGTGATWGQIPVALYHLLLELKKPLG